MVEGFFERSLSDIVDNFSRQGYVESFRGEQEGIRGLRSGFLHRPEELLVEEIERFEGVTDPEDEAIVLALRCRTHGCRGTYVAPYGKNMAHEDEWIASIPDVRHRVRGR